MQYMSNTNKVQWHYSLHGYVSLHSEKKVLMISINGKQLV